MKGEKGIYDYTLTPAGEELEPLVMAFGVWGHRWVSSKVSLEQLDPQLLMWDMRRRLNPEPMPPQRSVIQFRYPELPAQQRAWWMIVEPDEEVELCGVDPGHDVDLYVSCDLRTMTAIWMGHDTVRAALAANRLLLTGDRKLAANMQKWLGLSGFATEKAQV